MQELRYPGLECFPQFELAKKQMRDEHGRFAPGSMIHFVVRDAPGDVPGTAGTNLVDWIAQHAYCITLAVSLGQIKTLIECPYSMTHAAMPAEAKQDLGLVPGGC
ncbi:MAG: PLP-dependent transferase, partial [Planctomycetes bacterium]|nr:PLP-dependent transferase [Planctomycetota bacterium]